MNEWNLAEVKAKLAESDASVRPDAKMTQYDRPTGPIKIVVLDRVRAGWTPPYCTHGYASCLRCDQFCYLGHSTEKVVSNHEAYPLCLTCAIEMSEAGDLNEDQRVGTVEDHLRKDGPH